jgi:hypothetical protein
VTAFFSKIGYHITTTTLRAFSETVNGEKFQRGQITGNQRQSISRTIGHSVKTAEKHYLLSDNAEIAKDVVQSRLVDDSSDDEDSMLEKYSNYSYDHDYKEPIWGTEHPDYKTAVKRVHYSKAEMKYLCSILHRQQKDAQGNYILPYNFVSHCLKLIKSDNLAHPIFHERHTLNPGRLRSAFRKMNIGVD